MTNFDFKYFLSKKKFFFMFALVFFVYIGALFSGPVVSNDDQIKYNARNIYLPFGLGFSVGSDSGNYMRVANDPKLIFEKERFVNGRELVPGNVAISRPAFLYLTYLISKPIDLILKQTKIFNDNLVNNIEDSLNTGYQVLGVKQTINDSLGDLKKYYSTYAAFLLLNFFVIFLSFYFYSKTTNVKILNFDSFSKSSLWLGVFLIINDITKKYIVSPNPAIFNLIAVTLTLYFCSILRTNGKLNLLWMAFIFGICNLFYEVFICPLLTIYVIYIKIELEKKKSFFDIAKLISFSSLFFLFPYLVWIITVEFFFGGYSHYGIDSFPGFNVLNLNFFEAIQKISVKAFFSIGKTILLSLVIFLLIIVCLLKIIQNNDKINIFHNNHFLVGIVYSLTILIFFSSYGILGSRHLVGLGLAFLPFLNFLIQKTFKDEKRLIIGFFGFFIFYSYFMARKTYPYGEGIIENIFS